MDVYAKGNSLKGSRPILSFEKNFEKKEEYMIIKEMIKQIFSTPNGHPKSKPFVDHVFSFSILDDKIWFRNYQIVDRFLNNNKTEKQLIEIVPRLVLEPIRILSGSLIIKIIL